MIRSWPWATTQQVPPPPPSQTAAVDAQLPGTRDGVVAAVAVALAGG
jgi:hypothetical protein